MEPPVYDGPFEPAVPNEDPRPGKVGFVFGSIFWLAFLSYALQDGFYDWVIVQMLLFLIITGIIPGVDGIPLLGRMGKDIDKLIELYREKPEILRVRNLVMILVPGVNFIFMARTLWLFVPIFIFGVPLDIALEATTQFVLQLPQWGTAATQEFGETIIFEVILTAVTAPYLMFCALGIRPLFRRRKRR